MTDLRDGLVQYITNPLPPQHQSLLQSTIPDPHRQPSTPPRHDSFDVMVSDGLHNSSVGKVLVTFDRSSQHNHVTLETNSVLYVQLRESAIITSDNLRAAGQDDTDDRQVWHDYLY